MAINSKKKGNKAERYAAAIFNDWAKGKWKYGRVPMSGGLRWNRTKDTAGDITSTTDGHTLQFCVEVKSNEEIDFSQLLRPDLKNIKILDFWKQCTDDATRSNKIPLLMCRYNGLPKGKFFIVMQLNDMLALGIPSVKITKLLIYNDQVSKNSLVIFNSDYLYQFNYKEIHFKAKAINKNRDGKKIKTKKA